MKQLLVENAIDSFPDPVEMFPLVWDLGVGKGKGLFPHLNCPVGEVYFAIAFDQHDLVKVPSPVGDIDGLSFYVRF